PCRIQRCCASDNALEGSCYACLLAPKLGRLAPSHALEFGRVTWLNAEKCCYRTDAVVLKEGRVAPGLALEQISQEIYSSNSRIPGKIPITEIDIKGLGEYC
ncbi:hypothetical protein HAX54_025851, partial [Datura stramonium]|nr:hypothetical protein [Datura stramonium]